MRIFVAGPWGDYSRKDPWEVAANVAKANWVGQQLLHLGHEVYVPHTMCAGWATTFPKSQMLSLDRSFLEHWAEALFRIPGYSEGADKEAEIARLCRLSVFATGTLPTLQPRTEAIWRLLWSL